MIFWIARTLLGLLICWDTLRPFERYNKTDLHLVNCNEIVESLTRRHDSIDLGEFFAQFEADDHDDIATGELVPLSEQPVRQSGRNTSEKDYKSMHTSKPSKPAMVILRSERLRMEIIMIISTLRAASYATLISGGKEYRLGCMEAGI